MNIFVTYRVDEMKLLGFCFGVIMLAPAIKVILMSKEND